VRRVEGIESIEAFAVEYERQACPFNAYLTATGGKEVGTIYLIHFDKPIGNLDNPRAQAHHYLGWTTDLPSRLDRHSIGRGSAIMRAVMNSGVGWKVVKTWPGTRDDERRMKNQKNSKRYCPSCDDGK
jgi:hypothetical protein